MTFFARGVCGKQQGQGGGVGLVQAGGQHHAADLERCVKAHQRFAVGEGEMVHGVGIDVGEAVSRHQTQLVVTDQWIGLEKGVPGRAGVEPISGKQQLLGHGASARRRPRLEHDALVPGLGQIGRRDEAVVTSSGHDHVGCRRHSTSGSSNSSLKSSQDREPGGDSAGARCSRPNRLPGGGCRLYSLPQQSIAGLSCVETAQRRPKR